MWDLIVSVPDHCLSFYFKTIECPLEIGKTELNVSLFLRAYQGNCYPQILSSFIFFVSLSASSCREFNHVM